MDALFLSRNCEEVEEMQKEMGLDKQDFGPPPNLDKNPYYGIFAARKKSVGTQTANICPTPPSQPSEKDNLVEKEESLRNQRSWFLKQNEELLKLLDCLHKQEYDEVGHQEEEILDRISDFTLVLFEYVKTLKKRKRRGAVCVCKCGA